MAGRRRSVDRGSAVGVRRYGTRRRTIHALSGPREARDNLIDHLGAVGGGDQAQAPAASRAGEGAPHEIGPGPVEKVKERSGLAA